MLMHPDFMLALANERHRELIAEADRERLRGSVRKARRARKSRAVRAAATGTLATCEPSAAVPAR